MNSPEEAGTKHAKGPVLLPKVLFPDGSAMNDSTFIIQRFEELKPARSVYPNSEVINFICTILEDFSDEFLTKCMYHYRWVHDPTYAGRGIALMQGNPSISKERMEFVGSSIERRQVSRLAIVGSNDLTGPIIEEFYQGFIRKLDAHLASGYPFLLGSRPSSADFAVLGQLHPMISLDPKTSTITRSLSNRVCSWYSLTTDLSGLSLKDQDKGWITDIPPTLFQLLADVGKYYVPLLIANQVAYKKGEKEFSFKIDSGVTWTQPTFRYQSKCLDCLRETFESLTRKDDVLKALSGTGIEQLFTTSSL